MIRKQRLRVIAAASALLCILVYCTRGLRSERGFIAVRHDSYTANGPSSLEPGKDDADKKYFVNLEQLAPAREAESPMSTTSTASTTASTSLSSPVISAVLELPIIRIHAFGDSYTSYGFSLDKESPTLQNAQGNRLPVSAELCPSDQLTTCSYKWLDFVLSYYSAGSNVSLEETDSEDSGYRPSALAWNFARGSSTIDGALIWPEYPAARSLAEQVKEHIKQKEQEAQSQTEETGKGKATTRSFGDSSQFMDLHTIFFGINDVANTAQKENVDLEELYTRVMNTYTAEMEHLYQQGARTFLLFNVPPVDRTPELLDSSEEAREQVQKAVKLFNTLLEDISVGHSGSTTGGSFAERHLNARVKLLDMQMLFHGYLNADGERAWCVQGEVENLECAWLDKFHPMAALQKLIGIEVVKVMQPIVAMALQS